MTDQDRSSESRPATADRDFDPLVIFSANLIGAAALGYFLLGQKQKAIVGLLLFLALIPTTMCAGSWIVSAVAAIDGYLQAEAKRAGQSLGNWTMFRNHR